MHWVWFQKLRLIFSAEYLNHLKLYYRFVQDNKFRQTSNTIQRKIYDSFFIKHLDFANHYMNELNEMLRTYENTLNQANWRLESLFAHVIRLDIHFSWTWRLTVISNLYKTVFYETDRITRNFKGFLSYTCSWEKINAHLINLIHTGFDIACKKLLLNTFALMTDVSVTILDMMVTVNQEKPLISRKPNLITDAYPDT